MKIEEAKSIIDKQIIEQSTVKVGYITVTREILPILQTGMIMISPLGAVFPFGKPGTSKGEILDFTDISETKRYIKFDEEGHSEYGLLLINNQPVTSSEGIHYALEGNTDEEFIEFVSLETGSHHLKDSPNNKLQ